jgi:hypothetical protein
MHRHGQLYIISKILSIFLNERRVAVSEDNSAMDYSSDQKKSIKCFWLLDFWLSKFFRFWRTVSELYWKTQVHHQSLYFPKQEYNNLAKGWTSFFLITYWHKVLHWKRLTITSKHTESHQLFGIKMPYVAWSNTRQLISTASKKGKDIPVTGREGPLGCETSRLPHFL